jgi:hypothetical protein
MQKFTYVVAVLVLWGLTAAPASTQDTSMSFFLTSVGSGNGGDLGGLEGADQLCQSRAEAAGAGGKVWRAYLSTAASGGMSATNARDRIGQGPWHNANGVQIASSVDNLHSANNNLTKETILTETGAVTNGREDDPNRHDILTGSQSDGTAYPAGEDSTCQNWTTSGEGSGRVGHHDRQGGGDDGTSWNSAHGSRGCSQDNLIATGGNGLFYCFAGN